MDRRDCPKQIIRRVAERIQLHIPSLPARLKMSRLRDLASTEHPHPQTAIIHVSQPPPQQSGHRNNSRRATPNPNAPAAASCGCDDPCQMRDGIRAALDANPN